MLKPWPPVIPPRLARALEPFTFYRDGVCRSYRGQFVHVCGKRTPLEDVERLWRDKVTAIDAERSGRSVRRSSTTTYLEAAGEFYEWLDHRVATGTPEPMSAWTRSDYKRYVNGFGAHADATRLLSSFTQPDFTAYAKTFTDLAPSTLARAVANVSGFFQWCKDEGLISELPQFGRYFVRPAKGKHRDARIEQVKSFTPLEIRAQWKAARHDERAWLALGLNGALDNADLANLPLPEPGGVVDLEAGVIDFRRRKTGKVRRIIPMRPELVRLIRHYLKRHRPEPAEPAYAGLLFLTPTGLPLGRMKEGKAGRDNPIDSVARNWQRLMIRAGLRGAPVVTKTGKGKTRKRSLKFPGDADRRGFRSLRTTFANLAPVGYRDEVEIVMGHATNTVLVDSYLERYGLERLRELTDAVWTAAFPTAT